MKKNTIILIIVLAALLLIAGVFAVVGFWLPYHQAISSFDGVRELILYQKDDNSVMVQWPDATRADQYLLEVLTAQDGQEPTVLYSNYVIGQNKLIVKDLPTDIPCTISIRSAVEYTFLFSKTPRLRLSKDAIAVTDCFAPPTISHIQWEPDPDADLVTVQLQLSQGCTARLYDITNAGSSEPVDSFESGRTVLYFGDGKNWPVPTYGETYEFAFDAYRQGAGYTYYSIITDPVKLVREDLLGTVLNLTGTGAKNNQYTLTWNETKGDHYLVQHRASDSSPWQTLRDIPANGDRTYTTPSLDPYSYQEYRVIAQKNGASEEPIAQSEVMQIKTGSKVIYSTVWPIQDLTVYSDIQKTNSLGTAKAGTAFCVLDLDNDMFQVRYQNGTGYIDSRYCMINLSEFLGSLCSYDITNSYESLYKIHEYDIPEVTGEVIVGYERIRLDENSYLVPLLFPTALKLENAALSAAEEGYTLKIYDSFRPQAATYALYDQAYEFSQQAIPEEELPEDYIAPTAPEPTDPEETLPPYTYALHMTDNGRYTLNYFLAKGRSRHNQGVAMDMTLVNKNGDLPMQSDIHDLSWYSETKQNNSNANTLARIMKAAGFVGLVSEWWHFQDDESKNALDVPALWNGVTPECWMADENGWRFRRANGTYYTGCTATIDGVKYTFDNLGYASTDTQ